MEPHVPVSATVKQRLFLVKDFVWDAGLLQAVREGKTSTSYSNTRRAPVSRCELNSESEYEGAYPRQ